MSQLTRNLFISSITDKLAVGIPTPHSLLSRTIFKAMNPGAGASFGEQLRMLTAGNKIGAKKLLAEYPEMKSAIKKWSKKQTVPIQV